MELADPLRQAGIGGLRIALEKQAAPAGFVRIIRN